MFNPVFSSGKIFKKYLSMHTHPAKIRVQNIAGRHFFSKGILIKNAEGVQFMLDANDWITRIMLLEGDYESSSTELAKKILSNGGLFIDVGANFGLFTCYTAFQNNNIKVIAVEPNYKIIPWLLNNIKMNGLAERVQVIQTAVSNDIQFVTLEQPVSNNMGTTKTHAATNGLLSILSCPLNFICAQQESRIINLVKIDIEGNEFDVLENFSFDKFKIQNIILEFNHLSKVSFEKMQTFFAGKGFKSFTITGEKLENADQGIPENNIWYVNQDN